MLKVVFLIVALAIIIGFVGAAKAKAKKISPEKKQCIEESGATEADLEEFEKVGEEPTTKTGKCFLACIYKITGIFKNGKYHAESTVESLTGLFDPRSKEWEMIKTMAKTCEKSMVDESTSDECEYAAKASACEHTYLKKVGLM